MNGSKKDSTPLLSPQRTHKCGVWAPYPIVIHFDRIRKGENAETKRGTGIQPNHDSTVSTFCLFSPFALISTFLIVTGNGDTLNHNQLH